MKFVSLFERLARQIETEKPYGCSVVREQSGGLSFYFGVPPEDLKEGKIMPLEVRHED